MDFPIEIQSEFDYIVRSYQFVAAMFSSTSGYTGLLATLGAMGIFFGGMSAISAQAMSGRSAIQSWLANMAVASAVVVLLTSAKSTVIIHDTVTNQMRPVGGVPTVMATLAYLENRVELGVKEIMETVMSPIIPYDDIGKGEGFELLASMDRGANAYFTKSPHVLRSLEDYFKKCVLPDLSQGWIPEKAIYGTDDMWNSIKSNTRTRFSLVYGEGDSVGTLYSCADAWGRINPLLAVAQIKTAVTSQCEEKYDNAAAVRECENNVSDIVSGFVNGGTFTSIDLNSFIRSYLVSYAMYSSHGSLYSMLNEVNKKNASSAFMAEKMLPRLKGMMYGMIIGIFPLLICFMWFSPSKTIVFYAGLFVLLILWSSIDTFLDMQYQNEVYRMFTTMRNNGLGLRQMFDIPNIASDAMSLYGSGRWMALGLATAISAAITGINSYAISQMGSQLGATAQSAAGAAAGYMDSAGAAKLSQQAASDFGSRALANMMSVPNWNAYGIGQAIDAKAASVKNSMLTANSSPEAVANGQGAAAAVNAQENISAARAKLDYFNGRLPKVGDYAYRNSLFTTASNDAYLTDMVRLNGKDLAKIGQDKGQKKALSDSANTAEMNAQIDAIGEEGVINNAASKGEHEAGKNTAFFNNLKKHSDSLLTAGMNAGRLDALSLLRGESDMQGRIDASGGEKNYLTDAHTLGNFGQKSELGDMNAMKAQADLLNMNDEQYSEFIKNGNILDAKTADYLNNKFGTNVFAENQEFRFKVGEKGLTEMTLTDDVSHVKVRGMDFTGRYTTTLNDDGQFDRSVLEGTFDNGAAAFNGTANVDSSGRIIDLSLNRGSDITTRDKVTVDSSLSYNGEGILQSLISGSKDEALEGIIATYEKYRDYYEEWKDNGLKGDSGRYDNPYQDLLMREISAYSAAIVGEASNYAGSVMMSKTQATDSTDTAERTDRIAAQSQANIGGALGGGKDKGSGLSAGISFSVSDEKSYSESHRQTENSSEQLIVNKDARINDINETILFGLEDGKSNEDIIRDLRNVVFK